VNGRRAPTVLVVEDDRVIAGSIGAHLRHAGMSVECVEDGDRALRKARFERPDVVVLDLMLPGLDGWQVLRELRAGGAECPVVVVSARASEQDKVQVLKMGADDYVAKPFGRQELLARVQALLRRTGGKTEVLEAYQDDFVHIDYAQRRVAVQGRDVQLTPLEFKLLAAFVQNPNQVLSRDQLLELVWGDPYGVSGDQVKLYVGYLRRKLVPDTPDDAPIETVRGFGYRYSKA
jgi:DNA-binding response OmpR family regulator